MEYTLGRINIGKEEVKLCLFAGDMILHIENLACKKFSKGTSKIVLLYRKPSKNY